MALVTGNLNLNCIGNDLLLIQFGDIEYQSFILCVCDVVNFKLEIIQLSPVFLCISLTCLWQDVRLRLFEPRPTPTSRHQWEASSLSLLWQGAKKMWPWLRGRSYLQLSTSPSSEPLETRQALCLLLPVQGPPFYLDRRPFRSASKWFWVKMLFSVKGMTDILIKCCVCYHPSTVRFMFLVVFII